MRMLPRERSGVNAGPCYAPHVRRVSLGSGRAGQWQGAPVWMVQAGAFCYRKGAPTVPGDRGTGERPGGGLHRT